MSGGVVIRAEGLSKKYLIGHKAWGQATLRESMTRSMSVLARSTGNFLTRKQIVDQNSVEEFWALRDVSFEIKRGDVTGIVGRNGAGKSTLLRILSRITEPTAGRVRIAGRVSSLLEIGTGFHPDLTGRENIYLNGTILGMGRKEIRRKFDEIVAFADIERFLDTPVKRYSTGMYSRLAFAVAAHLDPDILIIDEVLAVGDVEFQRKCLGKMQDVARDGRTVLFVSHSIAAVEQLCSRALLLEDGQIRMHGNVREVMSEYLSRTRAEVLEFMPESDPSRPAELTRIALCDQNGVPLKEVTTADTLNLRIELQIRERRPDLKLAFALNDLRQDPIFASCPHDSGINHPVEPGHHALWATFPGPLLMPQRYSVTVSLYSSWSEGLHNCPHVLVFDVLPAASPVYSADPNRAGVMQIQCHWHDGRAS